MGEVQKSDGRGQSEYYTVMLDQERHKDQIESFLSEIMLRINKPNKNPHIKDYSMTKFQDDNLTLWLAPHYSILSLSTVQQNDMLVIGTHEQLEAASTFRQTF